MLLTSLSCTTRLLRKQYTVLKPLYAEFFDKMHRISMAAYDSHCLKIANVWAELSTDKGNHLLQQKSHTTMRKDISV